MPVTVYKRNLRNLGLEAVYLLKYFKIKGKTYCSPPCPPPSTKFKEAISTRKTISCKILN